MILLENIPLIKTLTSISNIRLQKFYRDINVNHFPKLHVQYVIYSRKKCQITYIKLYSCKKQRDIVILIKLSSVTSRSERKKIF